jgi:hypothetical protein
VIHLATRALISTYSKAAYYDPAQADIAIPVTDGYWDEVGLVRAISVKVMYHCVHIPIYY